jgi:adenylosuccinate synthase
MSLTPITSQLIADVGISFGDEGKGRLISEVVEELRSAPGGKPVSVVLKVNGGANSGHTAGGIKLNLLPAGIIESSVKYLAVGSGVVADPRKIWWEIKPLEKRGFKIVDRLAIDERTLVSDLTHRLLDLAWKTIASPSSARSPAVPPAAASPPPTATRPASGRSTTPISAAPARHSPASSPPAPTAPCAPSSTSAA